jgi:hypothetical protein
VKANANKNLFDPAEVQVKPQEYLVALDRVIGEDRAAYGKTPLKATPTEPETKEIKVSRTDEDSAYMVRDGKPKGFFYLDHRTLDGRHAIITDTHLTPASVHDSVAYLGRLDRQRERFGFNVRALGVDSGNTAAATRIRLESQLRNPPLLRQSSPPAGATTRPRSHLINHENIIAPNQRSCQRGRPDAYPFGHLVDC